MISPDCDFSEFVTAVTGLDFQPTRDAVKDEKRQAMTMRGVGRYVECLNGLRLLLDTGSKSGSVRDWEFAQMRPIIESLVEREKLKREALAIFASADR